ncbi:MAG TPA: tryptophan-rich sensory protein [Phycisphaerae bacterium]|nr:tryptophan-rich sensory protein [Phycisphaerae bacterium]
MAAHALEPAGHVQWGKLALWVGLCEAVGVLGALALRGERLAWYRGLEKPRFAPPDWIFGPVWTALYGLMGFSLYKLWDRRDQPRAKAALRAFASQLLLNASWTPVFFGFKSPTGGLAVIAALWLEVVETIARTRKVSPEAAAALLPYAAWVSFATVLNASIVSLNHDRPRESGSTRT